MKIMTVLLLSLLAPHIAACHSDTNRGPMEHDPRYAAGFWKGANGLDGATQAMSVVCKEMGCIVVRDSNQKSIVLETKDFNLELYVDELNRNRFAFKISEKSDPQTLREQAKNLFKELKEEGVSFDFDARGSPY